MLDLAEYDRAHKEYKSGWSLIDTTLRDICIRYPGHSDRRVVVAKLGIIGRTYAAGLERGVRRSGSQGGALFTVADHVYRNHARIDKIVGRVTAQEGPLDQASLEVVLRAHGQLDRLITEVRINGHSARSFASKYLHFHNPIVPIYDSYAWKKLRKLVPSKPELEILPKAGDPNYRQFLQRFWSLHRALRRAGRKPTARRIDSYLLYRE
jgi:hypothetical protein